MGKLYLVRHGRTAWNKGEIFRGQMDIPLDDVGRKQAHLVGEVLRGENISLILSSPLVRARETAEIIASYLPNVEVRIDERLTDIDVGQWGGLSLEEVRRRFPREFQVWADTPHLWTFPGGEGLKEVQQRVWESVLSYAPLLDKSGVVMVSHRLTLKTLILKAIGAGLESFWNIRVDTASISVFEHAEGKLVLTALNDTHHLKALEWKDKRDF
ncbi:MAG TPA: histidine phosphatase family protein [Firmicutes bacterium]|nr:histidine phosphatase family protein [Candidatus Fermentithermobacillaceae bacterium]